MNESDKELLERNSYKFENYLLLSDILPILVEWQTLTVGNVEEVVWKKYDFQNV
jgi:hypothetical protein